MIWKKIKDIIYEIHKWNLNVEPMGIHCQRCIGIIQTTIITQSKIQSGIRFLLLVIIHFFFLSLYKTIREGAKLTFKSKKKKKIQTSNMGIGQYGHPKFLKKIFHLILNANFLKNNIKIFSYVSQNLNELYFWSCKYFYVIFWKFWALKNPLLTKDGKKLNFVTSVNLKFSRYFLWKSTTIKWISNKYQNPP